MKCEKCKASIITEYAESYEQDWGCLCGVEDNERVEKKDGSLGCNLHHTFINKVVRQDNEMATDEYLRSGY